MRKLLALFISLTLLEGGLSKEVFSDSSPREDKPLYSNFSDFLQKIKTNLEPFVQFGQISLPNPDKPFFILFRDLHCNYEAQLSIAKAIETVASVLGMVDRKNKQQITDHNPLSTIPELLVLTEGADGPEDTSLLGTFPDKKVREEGSKAFMKEGKMTGAEFLSITRYGEIPIHIEGVEDADLYIENLKAFQEVIGKKEDIKNFMEEVKDILDQIKAKVYSPELKELEAKEHRYQEGKETIDVYGKYMKEIYLKSLMNKTFEYHGEIRKGVISNEERNLNSLGVESKIPQPLYSSGLRADNRGESFNQDFPNFVLFLEIAQGHKEISAEAVEKERMVAMDVLSQKLPKEELALLIKQALEYRLGKISGLDYWRNFFQLVQKNLDVEKYKTLAKYAQLMGKESLLNHETLLDEIEKIIQECKERLMTKQEQKEIASFSKRLEVLKKLLNLEMSRDDLEFYKSCSQEADIGVMLKQLKEFSEKCSVDFSKKISIEKEVQKISSLQAAAQKFYELALKRDEMMAGKALKTVNREASFVSREQKYSIEKETRYDSLDALHEHRFAVLITGGFHSSGIAKILKEAGAGFIVLTPRIKEQIEMKNYFQLMMHEQLRVGTLDFVHLFGQKLAQRFPEMTGDMMKQVIGDFLKLGDHYKVEPSRLEGWVGDWKRAHPDQVAFISDLTTLVEVFAGEVREVGQAWQMNRAGIEELMTNYSRCTAELTLAVLQEMNHPLFAEATRMFDERKARSRRSIVRPPVQTESQKEIELPFALDLSFFQSDEKEFQRKVVDEMFGNEVFVQFVRDSVMRIYPEVAGQKIQRVMPVWHVVKGGRILLEMRVFFESAEERHISVWASETVMTGTYESITSKDPEHEFVCAYGGAMSGTMAIPSMSQTQKYHVLSTSFHEGVELSDVVGTLERLVGVEGHSVFKGLIQTFPLNAGQEKGMREGLQKLVQCGLLSPQDQEEILQARESQNAELLSSHWEQLKKILVDLDTEAITVSFRFYKKTGFAQMDPRRNNIIFRIVDGRWTFKMIDFESMSPETPTNAIFAYDVFENKIVEMVGGGRLTNASVRPWVWTYLEDKSGFFEAIVKAYGEKEGLAFLKDVFDQYQAQKEYDSVMKNLMMAYLVEFLRKRGVVSAASQNIEVIARPPETPEDVSSDIAPGAAPLAITADDMNKDLQGLLTGLPPWLLRDLWKKPFGQGGAGGLIGKLFVDTSHSQVATGPITATVSNGVVTFTTIEGASLYTEDGRPAQAKVLREEHPLSFSAVISASTFSDVIPAGVQPESRGIGTVSNTGSRINALRDDDAGIASGILTPGFEAHIKNVLGKTVKVISDDSDVDGFSNGEVIYLKESLLKNHIALFHELGEGYFSKNSGELPEGVSAHTYLRGVGKDIRNLHDVDQYTDAEQLIRYIQSQLSPERINEAEFALIRWNASQGRTGRALLYGLQDLVFGEKENLAFSQQVAQRQEKIIKSFETKVRELAQKFSGVNQVQELLLGVGKLLDALFEEGLSGLSPQEQSGVIRDAAKIVNEVIGKQVSPTVKSKAVFISTSLQNKIINALVAREKPERQANARERLKVLFERLNESIGPIWFADGKIRGSVAWVGALVRLMEQAGLSKPQDKASQVAKIMRDLLYDRSVHSVLQSILSDRDRENILKTLPEKFLKAFEKKYGTRDAEEILARFLTSLMTGEDGDLFEVVSLDLEGVLGGEIFPKILRSKLEKNSAVLAEKLQERDEQLVARYQEGESINLIRLLMDYRLALVSGNQDKLDEFKAVAKILDEYLVRDTTVWDLAGEIGSSQSDRTRAVETLTQQVSLPADEATAQASAAVVINHLVSAGSVTLRVWERVRKIIASEFETKRARAYVFEIGNEQELTGLTAAYRQMRSVDSKGHIILNTALDRGVILKWMRAQGLSEDLLDKEIHVKDLTQTATVEGMLSGVRGLDGGAFSDAQAEDMVLVVSEASQTRFANATGFQPRQYKMLVGQLGAASQWSHLVPDAMGMALILGSVDKAFEGNEMTDELKNRLKMFLLEIAREYFSADAQQDQEVEKMMSEIAENGYFKMPPWTNPIDSMMNELAAQEMMETSA